MELSSARICNPTPPPAPITSLTDHECNPPRLPPQQEGYELVETHDGRGAVVVVDFVVDTGFMDLPASSVYTAGPHHALFSLSLTDVYHRWVWRRGERGGGGRGKGQEGKGGG